MEEYMNLTKNGRTAIGIIGLGVVRDAVRDFFEQQGYTLRVYDPERGLGSQRAINEAELVFVCVPAPFRPHAGFDDSALEEAVSLLDSSKVIVIKSTVLPGATEAYQIRYSQHCFLFNPDFSREAHARTDFVRPHRQIVGYTAQSRHLAEALLAMLPGAPFRSIMPSREAEMAKYMTSAFLALKVTFANEIFDLCTALDIDYERVRDAVAADPRIGPSHLDVLADGYRGYGGSNLPKDTKALLELSERLSVPLRLLRTADRVNASLLPPGDDAAAFRVLPFPPDGAGEEAVEEQAA
jgi:UDPglucose 6-dehydrogenase